jgi:hypothetical protein
MFVGAALIAFGAGNAFAQGVPVAPPPPPSSQGTDNPYNGPRSNDAGDSLNLTQAQEAARAVREGRAGANTGKGAASGPAAASEILAGAEVRDKRGKLVGSVESVDADGAVVASAAGKVKVPLDAFGKHSKGLMIGITKTEFETLVASAVATPAT